LNISIYSPNIKFNLLKGRFFEKKLGKKLQVLDLLPESVVHNFLKNIIKKFLGKVWKTLFTKRVFQE